MFYSRTFWIFLERKNVSYRMPTFCNRTLCVKTHMQMHFSIILCFFSADNMSSLFVISVRFALFGDYHQHSCDISIQFFFIRFFFYAEKNRQLIYSSESVINLIEEQIVLTPFFIDHQLLLSNRSFSVLQVTNFEYNTKKKERFY